MTRPQLGACLLLIALAGASGCANYRYEATGPDSQPLPVAKDRDLVFPAAPANLRLRQVESRCVLMIENPTTRPIALDGAASTIVDPRGESRAVVSQLIAPGSYSKLILPPYDDRPSRVQPGFQFGIGIMAQNPHPALLEPRKAHMLQITGPKQEYWEWSGEGEIRIILALRQDDQETVRRELRLRRTRK